jgi:tRNA dimethylallyltransferase
VDQQLAAGVVAEVQNLLAAGVPASAHAFSGLVYRQVIEYLAGARDMAATRELIIRENMQYARRQLVWFRKESGVRWINGPGEGPLATEEALAIVGQWLDTMRTGRAVTGHGAGTGVGDDG